MSVLEAEGLTVRAGARGVPVLEGVSFRVGPGRVLGLVGESGAGKSMLGRVVAGDLPPGFAVTGGTLTFGGEDLVGMAGARRRALLGREMAFIPQEPQSGLNPVRTVGSQMGEHLRRLGVRGVRRRAVELLESVRLRDPAALLGRYPHQLSGGQCQRVLIAMAFAGAPKLVVADEPTTALDATVQARVVAVLREMQARHGTAVVFITHDLRLAGSVCDEVLVLYAGRPAELGGARAVLGAPSHPYTRCLALANPALHGAAPGLLTLPEQMPGLVEMAGMAGCRFAPRCPVAEADCTASVPPLWPAGGSLAACFHPGSTGRIEAPAAARGARLAGEAVLGVEGLGKTFLGPRRMFGRRRGFTALRGVGLVVREGEFVGVVGESGSGKSTLARLVVGLERASVGRIVLAGKDVTAGGRRVGAAQMVFQNPASALNPRRRVGGIVTQALEVARPKPAAEVRRARGDALLASVGLAAEMAGRYPHQLSGGQRQRVNIARALCVLPRLLVADEIVSGLDVSVQAQLLALLERLRAEMGFAMLFISHDLAVVRHLCDRVVVMHEGMIVEEGPVDQVFEAPGHAYTRTLLAAVPG